jgi:hypothetical protein
MAQRWEAIEASFRALATSGMAQPTNH